jgi:hypothetical protein
MYKIISTLLLIGVITISQLSCKKYEEGPSLSLRSVKQRVTNTWKIESVTFNGTPLEGQPQYATQKQFWLGDGAYSQTYINPVNGQSERIDGRWELLDDNTKISLIKKQLTTGAPEVTELYTILKLRDKSMWLRSIDNSWEYHLVEQN